MGKRIAAITMARNDSFFLSRWLRYYAAQLGADNLYVLLDGLEQRLPDAERYPTVNVINMEHQALPRTKGDKARIALINTVASQLFFEKGYDLIIGTDCDEFVIVDPALNQSLPDYLSSCDISVGLSPLGIDLGQRIPQEQAIDSAFSILAQRRYAVVSPRYTKASVKAIPTPWGSGFHRLRDYGFTIAQGLYLVHIGNCDLELLKAKMQDGTRLEGGWTKHLARRAKTIAATTRSSPRPADEVFPRARRRFERTRLPWARKKPAHIGVPIVVELPQRFGEIFI